MHILAYTRVYICYVLSMKNPAVLCWSHSTFRCRTLMAPSRRRTRCYPTVRVPVGWHLAKCRLSTWQAVQHQNVVSRRPGTRLDDRIIRWIFVVMTVQSGCRAVHRQGLLMAISVVLVVRHIPSTWLYLRVFSQINLQSIMDSLHTAD